MFAGIYDRVNRCIPGVVSLVFAITLLAGGTSRAQNLQLVFEDTYKVSKRASIDANFEIGAPRQSGSLAPVKYVDDRKYEWQVQVNSNHLPETLMLTPALAYNPKGLHCSPDVDLIKYSEVRVTSRIWASYPVYWDKPDPKNWGGMALAGPKLSGVEDKLGYAMQGTGPYKVYDAGKVIASGDLEEGQWHKTVMVLKKSGTGYIFSFSIDDKEIVKDHPVSFKPAENFITFWGTENGDKGKDHLSGHCFNYLKIEVAM